jgi:hypothetical protein
VGVSLRGPVDVESEAPLVGTGGAGSAATEVSAVVVSGGRSAGAVSFAASTAGRVGAEAWAWASGGVRSGSRRRSEAPIAWEECLVIESVPFQPPRVACPSIRP